MVWASEDLLSVSGHVGECWSRGNYIKSKKQRQTVFDDVLIGFTAKKEKSWEKTLDKPLLRRYNSKVPCRFTQDTAVWTKVWRLDVFVAQQDRAFAS